MSADLRLKGFIDRVLRLKEEQDTLADDIREVYAEAKGEGYDKTAMGDLVSHLRKVEKKGADAVAEKQTVFDLYLDAYHRASGTPIATHAHAPDAKLLETVVKGAQTEVGRAALTAAVDIMIAQDETEQHSPASSSRQADTAGADAPPSAPAPIADAEVPAFLRKPAVVLRPHCLNPDLCAGSGRNHCHSCRKAMADAEAAA
jgi:uncharacterized protein (UPF0335 family)